MTPLTRRGPACTASTESVPKNNPWKHKKTKHAVSYICIWPSRKSLRNIQSKRPFEQRRYLWQAAGNPTGGQPTLRLFSHARSLLACRKSDRSTMGSYNSKNMPQTRKLTRHAHPSWAKPKTCSLSATGCIYASTATAVVVLEQTISGSRCFDTCVG